MRPAIGGLAALLVALPVAGQQCRPYTVSGTGSASPYEVMARVGDQWVIRSRHSREATAFDAARDSLYLNPAGTYLVRSTYEMRWRTPSGSDCTPGTGPAPSPPPAPPPAPPPSPPPTSGLAVVAVDADSVTLEGGWSSGGTALFMPLRTANNNGSSPAPPFPGCAPSPQNRPSPIRRRCARQASDATVWGWIEFSGAPMIALGSATVPGRSPPPLVTAVADSVLVVLPTAVGVAVGDTIQLTEGWRLTFTDPATGTVESGWFICGGALDLVEVTPTGSSSRGPLPSPGDSLAVGDQRTAKPDLWVPVPGGWQIDVRNADGSESTFSC